MIRIARWSIALVVCTGVLAVASVVCGALGVRNAGVVVSWVPGLSRHLSEQADGEASAVTAPLDELNLRAAVVG